jgi:ATP-dependent DNA ligase
VEESGFELSVPPGRKALRSLAGRQHREATALPGWIKPQLTKLVDQPPDGPEWLHELKFDGYRMHARLDRGAVALLTPHRARLDA